MYSIQAQDHRVEAFLQPASFERRLKVRFSFELRVRYRTLGRGYSLAGAGRVVNMSSGGMLVTCEHEIRERTRMEVDIEWPFLLDGRVPLQLIAVGRVVRSAAFSFAVVLDRHQFRTMRRPVLKHATVSMEVFTPRTISWAVQPSDQMQSFAFACREETWRRQQDPGTAPGLRPKDPG